MGCEPHTSEEQARGQGAQQKEDRRLADCSINSPAPVQLTVQDNLQGSLTMLYKTALYQFRYMPGK